MHRDFRAARRRAMWAIGTVGAMLGAAACGNDPLEVPNVNNPDRNQVLALPRDVESLASKLYQNVHAGTIGNTGGTVNPNEQADGVYQPATTMGFENGSGLNNYGMGPRGQIPRNFIENSRGNAQSVGNLRDFRNLQNTARTATVILEKLATPNFTLGTPGADLRLRAFTWFGYGTALGNVALAYDSAAIPLPNETETSPLVAYDSVMKAALAALDSAQVYASNVAMSNLPSAWLAQGGDMPRADFVKLIRSYKARFRAQVARNPAERTAVNWNAVIADATNGLTGDFVMQLVPGAGWDYAWLIQHFVGSNWHQMVPYIVNMADTTGAFDAWLALPREQKKPFLIRTPDNRFPRGETREAQIASSLITTTLAARPYLRNRPPGDDLTNSGWNESWYDHWRWRSLFLATRVGPWTPFSRVENDMYAAEGYIRTGNIAAAAALIDRSRTASNLPAIAGTVGSATDPIPGPACVPRVPVGPSFTSSACGNILEAMKWESRMESAYAAYDAWYFNGRGWGDLPQGTATSWPVPWQELDVRQRPLYNTGGASGYQVHGPSSYGYGTGAR